MNVIKKILKVLWNGLLLMIPLIVVGVCVLLFYLNNIPEVTNSNFWVNSNSTTAVFDRDGEEMSSLTVKSTVWQDLKNEDGDLLVSENYINGVIETEDRMFYSHNGINVKGLIRATLGQLLGHDAGGGSTITMQLAKLLYLAPEDSNSFNIFDSEGNLVGYQYDIASENPLSYKISQMLLALKIESKYTKDEIFENYMNTAYFANGQYGIYNASMYYYGKEPIDLTLEESALLAGIPQRPSGYNPYVYPEYAKERRDEVLYNLYEMGDIKKEEYEAAIEIPIDETLISHDEDETSSYIYDGVNDEIFRELYSEFGSSLDFNTAGMTIHTTVDSDIQKIVYDIQHVSNTYIYYPELVQAASVVLEPNEGGIIAIGDNLYTNEDGTRTNYALDTGRQPGSTAKPIVDYAAAIEFLGWSSSHIIVDEPTTYSDGGTFGNFDDAYKGSMYMVDALSNSRNTTAIKTFKAVDAAIGNDAYLDWFHSFGLTESVEDLLVESTAIGAFDTNVLEMAGAYGVLANGGTYNEPHIVDYVEFSENSPYYEKYGATYEMPYDSWEVMDESTAFIISDMLNPDQPMALTRTADVPAMDVAIKSGTTNFGDRNDAGIPEGETRDRWIIGYTPDVVTAVWSGYPTKAEKLGYYYRDSSDHVPEYIFKDIMQQIVDTEKDYLNGSTFEAPSNVISQNINGRTFYSVEGGSFESMISKPTISIDFSNGAFNTRWSLGSGVNTSQIYVDNSLYKSFTGGETSYSIPLDSIVRVYGCKDNYSIFVRNLGSSGQVDSNVANVTGVASYCSSNETTNEDVEPDETDEEDVTPDEHTEEDETVEAVDGGTDETVDGGTGETVDGGTVETVDGGTDETIDGGTGETVDGGTDETVDGGTDETVDGGTSETVDGGIVEAIDGGTI